MTAGARVVTLALGLALAISGCGGDDGKDGGDGRGPSQTADRLPSEPREAPPAGVAEQVEFFEIGNGSCPDEATAPTVDFFGGFPEKQVAEIGQTHFQICLLAFDPELPVDVTVTRPDGREVVESVEPIGNAPVRPMPWDPLPGDPVGSYTVTARQGAATATGSFEVRRSSMQRLRTAERFVLPGEPIRVVFAGFSPRETVRFHLYREDRPESASGQFSFLATRTVRMDGNGEAIHEIETDPGAARRDYLVRISEKLQYLFDIGEPPPGYIG